MTNLNDVLKTSNTTFKVKKFEDKFKKDMIEKWHDEFSTIWNSKDLHQRLTELNEKKQKQQQQQQQLQQPHENDTIKNAWYVFECIVNVCRFRVIQSLVGFMACDLNILLF